MIAKKIQKAKSFALRMPPDLHEKVATAAFETHIPMNGFILQAIIEKLKRGDHLDALVTTQGKGHGE